VFHPRHHAPVHPGQGDERSSGGSPGCPAGRWNSLGFPVVHASSSIALACLEALVHITGDRPLPLVRWLVAIEIPAEQWQLRTSLMEEVPSGWDAKPSQTSTKDWGDPWLASQNSLIAEGAFCHRSRGGESANQPCPPLRQRTGSHSCYLPRLHGGAGCWSRYFLSRVARRVSGALMLGGRGSAMEDHRGREPPRQGNSDLSGGY